MHVTIVNTRPPIPGENWTAYLDAECGPHGHGSSPLAAARALYDELVGIAEADDEVPGMPGDIITAAAQVLIEERAAAIEAFGDDPRPDWRQGAQDMINALRRLVP